MQPHAVTTATVFGQLLGMTAATNIGANEAFALRNFLVITAMTIGTAQVSGMGAGLQLTVG